MAPRCALLHWVGSLLAWKYGSLEDAVGMAEQGLDCLGDIREDGHYLRYELAVLHLVRQDWPKAYGHISVCATKPFHIAHRVLLLNIYAGVLWQTGEHSAALEILSRVDGSPRTLFSTGKVSENFIALARAHLRRAHCGLLVFEILYVLRQFSRLPPEELRHLLTSIKVEGDAAEERQDRASHASAVMLQLAVGFHLGPCAPGSAGDSQPLVLAARGLVDRSPSASAYLNPHLCYWCARACSVMHPPQRDEERKWLRRAAAYKRYPFDISKKVQRCLELSAAQK
jgi:hypothetical protein